MKSARCEPENRKKKKKKKGIKTTGVYSRREPPKAPTDWHRVGKWAAAKKRSAERPAPKTCRLFPPARQKGELGSASEKDAAKKKKEKKRNREEEKKRETGEWLAGLKAERHREERKGGLGVAE